MVDDTLFVFPPKMLKRFITMYRDLPCLWDRSCVAYKHKAKRHEAISKLTSLVQEFYPSATRVHVLRKIESLRSCVRREHKRVQMSQQKATNADEVYVPHLWYYEMLSFVFGEDDSNYTPKPMPEQPEDLDDCTDDNGEEEKPHFEQPVECYPFNSATNSVDLPTDRPRYSPVAKRYLDDDPTNSSKRLCTEVGDEYDAIGINVAAKLRNLPSNMRILAEKLINDVLYQAQTNSLNSSSVVSTSDPFKQCNI